MTKGKKTQSSILRLLGIFLCLVKMNILSRTACMKQNMHSLFILLLDPHPKKTELYIKAEMYRQYEI